MKSGAVILFIGFWILLVAFLAWKNPIAPDLSDENIQRYEAEGEPCQTFGHPLWTDC